MRAATETAVRSVSHRMIQFNSRLRVVNSISQCFRSDRICEYERCQQRWLRNQVWQLASSLSVPRFKCSSMMSQAGNLLLPSVEWVTGEMWGPFIVDLTFRTKFWRCKLKNNMQMTDGGWEIGHKYAYYGAPSNWNNAIYFRTIEMLRNCQSIDHVACSCSISKFPPAHSFSAHK